MLQNLIVERFRLAYHYEKKQMQVYELAVAKGGLKMKESAAPDPSAAADHESPKASPQSAGRGVSVDSEGYPILAPGQMAVVNGLARWISSETEMEQIVSMVSAELDAPVKDSTRLEGKYDFTLSWVTVRDPASDLHGPRLEEAIQKQLGLKLERTKGLVDVFVIDHVEKVPVEN